MISFVLIKHEVNGKMIPLNEIQEEDQRNMTTEEYKVKKEFF
jgi:transcription initiation factor TFIIE subunit alpha